MTGLEMLQHTEFTVMRDYINNAPIVNYGIVLEVYSQKSVKVAVMSSIEETTLKLDCSVLFTSSKHLEVSHKLEVGDKGLILSLQNFSKDIFSSDKPIEKGGRKGYSVFSCVFIPYNTLKEADETTTKLTLDDEQILLKTKVPVTIESEKELIADVKEVQLCGDTKNLVTHAELDTALQTYAGKIQAEMLQITAGAAQAISAGGFWTAPLLTIGQATIDIASSKAEKVKTS
jgi:hypothetical protein